MLTARRIHRSFCISALIIAPALLVGSGCGKKSTTTTTTAVATASTTTTPSMPAMTAESSGDFARNYRAISTAIQKLGSDVGKSVTGASSNSDEMLAKNFGKLARNTNGIVQLLEDMTAPNAKLTRQKEALINALTVGADDLDAIAEAAGAHDVDAARKATIKLSKDSPAIAKARKALDAST